jgi:ketosteroid isomerase-like protein
MNADAAVDRIVALFESMVPGDVHRLHAYYRPDAWFKDPFNEVRGLPRVQRVFAHMFEALEQPRFRVTTRIVQGGECFLAWEFRFGLRRGRGGKELLVRGGSHLKLADDGRIASHRDYLDAAEELYEKLPVLGALMRWLKRRAAS